jgi:hypothetical protein
VRWVIQLSAGFNRIGSTNVFGFRMVQLSDAQFFLKLTIQIPDLSRIQIPTVFLDTNCVQKMAIQIPEGPVFGWRLYYFRLYCGLNTGMLEQTSSLIGKTVFCSTGLQILNVLNFCV